VSTLRTIPAPAQVLLGSDALAHVITRNPSGTPQVSVVWCGVRGDKVVFCTEGATAKVRNIRRDPHVILSIEDEAQNLAGTQQHLVVHGTAAVVGPADPAARSRAASRLISGHMIGKISVPCMVPIVWRQRAGTPASSSSR
jgi:PPOX class probable F420-dependent enzyme